MKLSRPGNVLKTLMLGASALSVAATKAPPAQAQDSYQCSSGLTVDIHDDVEHTILPYYFKTTDNISATIESVKINTPAAKAGLKAGDKIQEINYHNVSLMDAFDAQYEIKNAEVIDKSSRLNIEVNYRRVDLECPKSMPHHKKLYTHSHQ